MQVLWIEDFTGEIPMSHCPEHLCAEGEWKEQDYNYRLNTCDEILVLVENNQIIGHMGLRDSVIRAVAIDEAYQGQGLSYKLYDFALNFYEWLYSDDAREPVATHIWQNLKKQYPSQITYDKHKDQFRYSKSGD
jgi:hypothetical protein